jgi:hypothetical protein
LVQALTCCICTIKKRAANAAIKTYRIIRIKFFVKIREIKDNERIYE